MKPETKQDQARIRMVPTGSGMPGELASLLQAFEGLAASCRDRGAVPREVADALVARSRALRRNMKTKT
jgi:hypothetical protein